MAQRMESPAIGIDLGTSYCCVAVWRNNWVDVIPDELGSRTTPSYVAFTDSERLIGDAARGQAAMNPTNTIYDVKRLIGRHTGDQTVEDDTTSWPFKVTPTPDDKRMVTVRYKDEERQFAPEEIAAMLLSKLRDIAETDLGRKVNGAVISVPAKFDVSQRQATKDAALVAGLGSARLINETSAAALAYCLDRKTDQLGTQSNVLIFNLGAGMLDISLFCIEEGIVETKASVGDMHLGGEDFNSRLVDYFVGNFRKKYNKDISGNPRKMRKLLTACEKAKRALSSATQTTIEIDFLFEETDFFANITRAKFEEINADLFCKCIDAVDKCLKESKTDKSEVDEVVLVGGSSRIPKVQQLLSEYFGGKELCKSVNPDEAVACGAAILAAGLTGEDCEKVQDLLLLDSSSHSFGLETAGRVMTVLLPRNTTIPTKVEQVFAACPRSPDDHFIELHPLDERFNYVGKERNRSQSVMIRLFEGERVRTRDNTLIGEMEFPVSFAGAKGWTELKVTFDIDANIVLTLSVEEAASGHKEKMVLCDSRVRSSEYEVKQMMRQAEKFREEDEELQKTLESKNALENYAYRVRNSIKTMEDEVERTIAWLDANQSARAERFDEKMKGLKSLCNRLINN